MVRREGLVVGYRLVANVFLPKLFLISPRRVTSQSIWTIGLYTNSMLLSYLLKILINVIELNLSESNSSAIFILVPITLRFDTIFSTSTCQSYLIKLKLITLSGSVYYILLFILSICSAEKLLTQARDRQKY